MKILVPLVATTIIVSSSHAGTQSTTDRREEEYSTYGPNTLPSNPIYYPPGYYGKLPYNGRLSIENGPDGPIMRETYTCANGVGIPQTSAPWCEFLNLPPSQDSNGSYSVDCRVLVEYGKNSGLQPYDPAKSTANINKFAIDTYWRKNGTQIDPTKTSFPGPPSYVVQMHLAFAKGNNQDDILFLATKRESGYTVLTLRIDDVVYVNGVDAVINYSWDVSPGISYISAMKTKMYMEQLDSNIEMSYVKPDGSGSAVIVPNNCVTLEDTSQRLASNGQIKLKLNNKTGFGPRSSRLRVTVEWQ
ncbi:hypothetical protein GP664_25980 [Escherichia coli]|uniref:hypothetical protein n=1 Tax=Escherichia coli TaxID=562 RepID=UPI0012FD8ACE|nr:hypothetical protein [Escherichia coli]MVW21872.1 hypothetical protein [Escherichia coli]